MPDEPIWLRPERAGHGPAPEHTRERIAAAGIALADADGLAAVSMRKVAAALGAGTASLYRYVATRDELVALMVDAVNGELGYPRPTTGDWRADLLAIGHDLRTLYRRHTWLVEIQPAATGIGPNGVAYLEQALAALSVLDRPAGTKLEAVAMLSGVVSLLARDEASARSASTADGRAATARYLAAVATPERYPHLAAALGSVGTAPAVHSDPFDRVIGGLLEGLLGGQS
ncbi:TetR/AcrR family transcriptional regulator C-terminal domain-containing protein [Cryptosporangium aurantiacum]|uniref:Transcriptional regulator, TetR family n=1 Tax=Cryptosporangium aurantiacum TaxID=134849 RepID=A0A1M7JUL7_9ACTN|nr:TetR/AcrR family transcriptional regulator C-terminal domain-containing protein [Cryptosporangium aurantiacum]SHM56237.1 transcriptional regulator, TetR family [Cryptosporangium aurantiacum]